MRYPGIVNLILTLKLMSEAVSPSYFYGTFRNSSQTFSFPHLTSKESVGLGFKALVLLLLSKLKMRSIIVPEFRKYLSA